MPICPTCKTEYPDGVETCPADGARLRPDDDSGSSDPDLVPGQQVGEYLVEGKIGEGGFGTVYRAVHPLIGKAVAIKALSRQYSANPQMVSRFVAEARAVNQIRHRNIIDIFSFGKLDDGRHYYVMELLEGLTLDAFIRRQGRVAPDVAIPILRAVARAIDAAHAAGIAHRDLKPDNVFLVVDEEGSVFPKLLDFGIAKLTADSGQMHKTRTGTPIGTPHYMSPEQCRGRDVGPRTDVYSFGVVAHQMLTGRVPFDAETVMDLLFKHTAEPPPPVSSVCPDLSPELDAPLLHMLAKDPEKRPATLGAAVDALARAATSAGYAVPPTGPRAASADAPQASPSAPRHGTLAEARTMLQPDGRTLRGAESDIGAPPKRTAAVVAVAAALVVGVAAAFFVFSQGESQHATAAAPPVQPETSAPPPAASPPAPQVEPAAPPSVAPSAALAAEVALTIQSTPAEVEVYRGADRLGVSPGPIRLPRGEGRVKLTFKAEGHKAVDVEVTPSADGVVSVTLPAAAKARPKTPGELENPF